MVARESRRSRPGQRQGFNPLAFGIAIGGSVSASDSLFSDVFGATIFPFRQTAFRGTVLCSAEVAQYR
jgi:hypothetical protein